MNVYVALRVRPWSNVAAPQAGKRQRSLSFMILLPAAPFRALVDKALSLRRET
jgi:hypothetical protein